MGPSLGSPISPVSDTPQLISKRPAPRGTAAYPRKRAVTACQVCRARRTKCDNKKPSCSFCERVGAKCISSPVDLSPFDPASLKILERLDQLEETLALQHSQLLHQTQHAQYPNLPQQVPQGAAVLNDTNTIESEPSFHTLCISITDVLSWPVFEGRYDAHLDVKSLLRKAPLDGISQSPASDAYVSIGDLDCNTSMKLLEIFLQHVHVKNPILDEKIVRQMVQRVSLDGFGWDAESCLVLLIYALGSIASSFGTSSPDSTNTARANSYFTASQKRIGTLLGKGGVVEAQCFFFSGVYLMSVLQPIQAWRHFVQALACCQEFDFAMQSLPLERNTVSESLRGPPSEESVYWTCWKSEIELRQHLQLPDFTLNGYMYPRLFPTPPSESGKQEHREWYYYLAEISLRRLDARVRNEICHTQRPSYEHLAFAELSDSVLSYEEQVNTWIHSLPEMMSLQTPEADDDVLKFILRGHLMNFYELIYWPFVEAAINQEQGPRAAVVEEYGQKGLNCCIERIQRNKPGFTHRHHGTWFMIQSCTRSALVILAAARTTHAAGLLPDGWDGAVIDVIEMLRFWEHEVGDAGDRLHILEELLASV